MNACVFSGYVSVLVNGSPTEEVPLERGLWQGDPLALFLFLIIAEGLSRLMSRALIWVYLMVLIMINRKVFLFYNTLMIPCWSVQQSWIIFGLLKRFIEILKWSLVSR